MKTALILAILVLSLALNGWVIHRLIEPQRTDASADVAVAAGPRPATPAQTGSAFPAEIGARVKALRSAGTPDSVIRSWVREEIDRRFASEEKALSPAPRMHYWLPEPQNSLENTLALIDLRVKKARLVDETAGFDPAAPENGPFSFLPGEKRPQVKYIAEALAAKVEAYRLATAAMPTAREQAEVARLEAEGRQALAAFLTDGEQTQLMMRLAVARWKPAPPNSLGYSYTVTPLPVIERVRRDLRHFDSTEGEFMAIVAIEQELEPVRRFGGMDTGQLNTTEADRVRDALGAERFAEYKRTADQQAGMLLDLGVRMNLAPEKRLELASVPTRVTAESARIYDDPSLDLEGKRAALLQFATQERSRLAAFLGPDGMAAIATTTINRFIVPLEQGNALIAMPGGSISTRPVGSPAPRVLAAPLPAGR